VVLQQTDALTGAVAIALDHKRDTRNAGDFARSGLWLPNPWT